MLDPEHAFHAIAHQYWKDDSKQWASCPLIENGVVRVLTGKSYPGKAAYSNESVIRLFRILTQNSDHEFWADDISILDKNYFDFKHILGPRQLTDIYLLGLAASKGGRLVTFDRKITTAPVPGASDDDLFVISGGANLSTE